MKTILLNADHSVTQTETITEANSLGYLIFQWAYLVLIFILVIMAIASVFGIFKPKPKVYENENQDYLSKDHFKKYM